MVGVVFVSHASRKSSSDETKMSPDIFVIIFGGRFGGHFLNFLVRMDGTHRIDTPSTFNWGTVLHARNWSMFLQEISPTSRRGALDFNDKVLQLETALPSSCWDSVNGCVKFYIPRRNNMALDIFFIIFGGRFGGRFWNYQTYMEIIQDFNETVLLPEMALPSSCSDSVNGCVELLCIFLNEIIWCLSS